MSGHLRLGLATFLLLAGFSASPASSNPFAALFSVDAAPAEGAVPTPGREQCLPQPGKSTAEGQHWFYHVDGHRKCWFQAAKRIAAVKKPVHHHGTKQRITAAEENEAALREQKAVVDARAELLNSAAPAEAPQPAPPAPNLKMTDAASVPATGAAALVPPPPVVSELATDQLTPEHRTPLQVNVEALLASAPAARDAVASVPPAMPVAVPLAEATDQERGWTATWLGVLLMALGAAALLSSSRTLRRAMLVGRFLDRRKQLAAVADDGFRKHLLNRASYEPAWSPPRKIAGIRPG